MGLAANDDLNRLGTYKPADEGSLRAVVIDSQAAGQLVRARRQLIGLYQRTKAVDGLRPRQCIEHDRLCRLNRGDHFTRVFACSQGLHPSAADDEDSLTIASESSLDLELDEKNLSDMAQTAFEAETMEDVGSDIESLDAQLDVDAEMSIDERFGLESTFSERLNLVTSTNETTLMSWLAGQLEWANFEWLRPSTRTSEVSDFVEFRPPRKS